jgi:hypothetical protein
MGRGGMEGGECGEVVVWVENGPLELASRAGLLAAVYAMPRMVRAVKPYTAPRFIVKLTGWGCGGCEGGWERVFDAASGDGALERARSLLTGASTC